MTSQDVFIIIGINIVLFAMLSIFIHYLINKIHKDIKTVCIRLDKMDCIFDEHAQHMNQLYKMFVDLLKERK